MQENPKGGWGKRIEIQGKGRLKVGEDIITESAVPRKNFVYPEGSIASLRPLLRGLYHELGIERDDYFWSEVDNGAKKHPNTALKDILFHESNKEIPYEIIARTILLTDGELKANKESGKLPPQDFDKMQNLLAARLLRLFQDYL